jgi:hypothetical protein
MVCPSLSVCNSLLQISAQQQSHRSGQNNDQHTILIVLITETRTANRCLLCRATNVLHKRIEGQDKVIMTLQQQIAQLEVRACRSTR